MSEKWVDIKDYKGLYEISDTGKVRNVVKNKTLRISNNGNGYLRVGLRKDDKRRNFLLHRLLALSFIPNPDNKSQVNHINGIKTDNRVENLEWCTNKENNVHAIGTGLLNNRGSSHGRSKLTEEDVYKIREMAQNKLTDVDISGIFKVSPATVYYIRTRKTWKHI